MRTFFLVKANATIAQLILRPRMVCGLHVSAVPTHSSDVVIHDKATFLMAAHPLLTDGSDGCIAASQAQVRDASKAS